MGAITLVAGYCHLTKPPEGTLTGQCVIVGPAAQLLLPQTAPAEDLGRHVSQGNFSSYVLVESFSPFSPALSVQLK